MKRHLEVLPGRPGVPRGRRGGGHGLALAALLAMACVSPDALALTPSEQAGLNYLNANCSSCHGTDGNGNVNFSNNKAHAFAQLSTPASLYSFVNFYKANSGAMTTLANETPQPSTNITNIAAYMRVLGATSLQVNVQYSSNGSHVQGTPSLGVHLTCTATDASNATVTTDDLTPTVNAGSSIASLVQGASCTVTQTSITGTLDAGYQFGASSAVTPQTLMLGSGANAVTLTNSVTALPAATLQVTPNLSPSGAVTTTPNVLVSAACTSGTHTGSGLAGSTVSVGGMFVGDVCSSVTASIDPANAGQLALGYTYGSFTSASNLTLTAGGNPLTLTNTLVYTPPPATVQVSGVVAPDSTHITTQPQLQVKLSCNGRADQTNFLAANGSVSFPGLLTGNQCQVSEISVSSPGVLTGNYTFSPTPTSIAPSGSFTLVPGTNSVTITHTVIAPGAAQFSMPGPLTFAAEVGHSDTQSTTISNTAVAGSAFLSLTALTFSNAQYGFGPGNTCTSATVLAPVSSCALVVTFTPAPPVPQPNAPEQRYATLTVTHDAAGSPATLDLHGTANPAPSPSIQISDAMPAIADTYLGSSSSASITVMNGPSATATLQITALTFSDVAAADYTLGTGAGACAVGSSLAKGDSCTITIRFTPSQVGTRSAKLTIANNTPATLPNATPVITLAGKGVAVPLPLLTIVTPTPIHFGNRTVGGSYQPQVLTLANSGTADLLISSVQVAGAAFSTADSCAPALAPGAQCQLRIQYRPTTAGQADTGSVIITSNAAGSPQAVALDGSGVTYTAPVFVWSSAGPLDFGNVSAGTPSATQALTITNMGPGDATLTLVSVTGVDAVNFVLNLQGCQLNQTVIQGASCTVSVQFVPTASGSRKATLQWASSGSAPAPVVLQGTGLAGVAAQLALSSSTLDFGTVRVGANSLPQELTLQSRGSSLLHVMSINVSAPYQLLSKDCSEPPFDLTPGMQCKLVLGYAPTAAGSATGTVRIASNSAQTVPDVALSGQGQPVAEVSGGGCSLASGRTVFDPTLLVLVLAAALILLRRRQRARRMTGVDGANRTERRS